MKILLLQHRGRGPLQPYRATAINDMQPYRAPAINDMQPADRWPTRSILIGQLGCALGAFRVRETGAP